MLLPILLGCVCVLVVTIYLQYRWRHRHVLEAASKLPCPPTLPLIGNAHLLIGDRTKLIKRLMQWAHQYNGLYCVWAGPIPFIFVSNPDDVKIILNNSGKMEKAQMYAFMVPYLGQGLVTASVSIWKRYRRLINRFFQISNLERMLVDIFNKVGKGIVRALDQQIDKDSVDPKDIIMDHLIVGTIESVTGYEVVDVTEEEIAMGKELLDWAAHSVMIRTFNPAYYYDFIFNVFYWNKQRRASICHSVMLSLIKKYMNKYKSTKGDNIPKQWISILDIWDENTCGMLEDSHWLEEYLTLLAAAIDTTLSSVHLLLVSIAANQDVQYKLYAEIQEVVGSRDRDLTLSDLNSLKYLGHVITESMRLHGVVPFIGRLTTEDTKLSNIILPAGTNIYIHLHAMGWDSKVFSEPDRFNPDRFHTASEQEYSTATKSLMTFGGGPRNCIGKNYAIMSLKCIIVHILRKFELSTAVKLEDIEYKLGFVTHPKHPCFIGFHERQ